MDQNKDVVQVVRYLRPKSYNNMFTATPFKNDPHKHTNLHGITAVFTIDYRTRLVGVAWSVCVDDNFDKFIGKAIADLSLVDEDRCITFILEDVQEYGGLMNAFLHSVSEMLEWEYPRDYTDTVLMLIEAIRFLES